MSLGVQSNLFYIQLVSIVVQFSTVLLEKYFQSI